jgi:hypothetical protein
MQPDTPEIHPELKLRPGYGECITVSRNLPLSDLPLILTFTD